MNKTILIFAYYSYKDPVFQSAVLPYFKKLRSNTRFVLLTFEKKEYQLTRAEIKSIKEDLKNDRITWYRTSWHSGRFKKLKKVYDFFIGVFISFRIARIEKVQAIYSEGFPGAIIGHFVSKILGLKHIVHTYEPHADYMLEAGVWQENSWEYRLLKKYELEVAKSAYLIITATKKMVDKLRDIDIRGTVMRMPSCVDEELFDLNFEQRSRLRLQMGWENKIVIVYLGKFGGMYWDDEIFNFFRVCEDTAPDLFEFLLLTHDSPEPLIEKIQRCSRNSKYYHLKRLTHSEVSEYLVSADFGLVPIKPVPSKQYCSPIKNGEYWAAGLPIIIPKGVSDDYLAVLKNNIGLVLNDISVDQFQRAVEWMIELRFDGATLLKMRHRCRDFVLTDRSINLARKKLDEVFKNL